MANRKFIDIECVSVWVSEWSKHCGAMEGRTLSQCVDGFIDDTHRMKNARSDSAMVSHLLLFSQNRWNVCVDSNAVLTISLLLKPTFTLDYGRNQQQQLHKFRPISRILRWSVMIWTAWHRQLQARPISNRTIYYFFAQLCRCFLKPFSI